MLTHLFLKVNDILCYCNLLLVFNEVKVKLSFLGSFEISMGMDNFTIHNSHSFIILNRHLLNKVSHRLTFLFVAKYKRVCDIWKQILQNPFKIIKAMKH